jgi:hypothetical protein
MACERKWTAGNHPTAGELLLAWEEELPREQAAPIRAHLGQCWECRARVERYTRGMEAYVKVRKSYLDPAVRPRQGGWLRFAARLRDTGSIKSSGRRTFWERMPKAAWLALPAIAAAALVIAVMVWPAQLTATVVLDRAIRAESAASAPPAHRVVVRRGGRVLAADEGILNAAHIDRAHPLSVRSFRAWHDSLRTKEDAVTTVRDEISLETKTPEGAIALARLTVTRTEFAPRSKHVELRDGITIDVETVEGAPAPPVPETALPASESLARAGGSGVDAAAQREALELEVRWALHRIDADLGEALEIRPGADKLAVSGTLDDPARRDRITQALAGFPQVSIQLRMAAADENLLAGAQPIDTREAASGPASIPLLASRLVKDLPDPEARRGFVSTALGLSQSMLRHTWALRRLAQRYPRPAESALPPAVRASLRQLVSAHQDAIRSAAQEAASLWTSYVQLDTHAAISRSWQDASLEALQCAQRADHFVARLLAAGGNDGLGVSQALDGLRESQRQLLSALPQERP